MQRPRDEDRSQPIPETMRKGYGQYRRSRERLAKYENLTCKGGRVAGNWYVFLMLVISVEASGRIWQFY
jgi:hypothetical protein